MKDDKPLSEPVKYQGAEQILKGRFEGIPFESPVKPVQLELDSEIQFDCHPGVACFNECCRNIDIQLTPYDIVCLKQRLGVSSQEFVARYTLPFAMDFHGLPGLNLITKPASRECVFLGEDGCTVYEDRPAACRYYALGVMGVRSKESPRVEDVFFLVKESHCLGHNEPRRLTVRRYREEQGVDKYDNMNREWRDLIIKKRSSGPTIGKPSERSMQLFDMCSYDMDSFREFIQTPGFQDIFDVDAAIMGGLLGSDEQLLQFAFRFLKQVLFGEQSIPVKAGAGERRLEARREHITKKRQAEIEAHKAHDPLDDVSGADE
jgi:hypothetical protein